MGLSTYEFDTAEALGYVGGAFLAVSLVPQVMHTLKTKSTKDISYCWQVIYIVGSIFDFAYYVLIKATAAWVTLIVELLFAVLLLVLKMRIDSFEGACKSTSGKNVSRDTADTISSTGHSASMSTMELGLTIVESGNAICVEGNIDLTRNVGTLKYKDAIKFRHDSSIGPDTLVKDAYRGFHIMIDVVFNIELPAEFGNELLARMCELAKMHGVRVVHDHAEIFDGTESRPGFAAVALLDESHMSAHCYSDQGKLAFDVFTCGADPDCTRRVARDVLFYLRQNLGSDAKYQIHRLPRFPVLKADDISLESLSS